jgi:lipoate-protein ligase A
VPQAWPAERLTAHPARIHGRDQGLEERRVVLCRPTVPALVLGSTQPAEAFDPALASARGLEIVRRRSGGGAVLVRPGRLLWVEVVVPVGDPLWEEDLGRSFLWLGRAWEEALRACGVARAGVYEGPLMHSRWSRTICFAGLGPGEVTVAGRKVVGLSQRRRREGAVFQCAALLTWEPEDIAGVVAGGTDERSELARELAQLAAPVGVDEQTLTTAFTHSLPS